MVMLKAPTKMGSSFLSILEHLKAHKYLCSYIKMQCLPTLQWLINFFFLQSMEFIPMWILQLNLEPMYRHLIRSITCFSYILMILLDH